MQFNEARETEIFHLMSAELRSDLSRAGHNSDLIRCKNLLKQWFINNFFIDFTANKTQDYRRLKSDQMLMGSPGWPIKFK